MTESISLHLRSLSSLDFSFATATTRVATAATRVATAARVATAMTVSVVATESAYWLVAEFVMTIVVVVVVVVVVVAVVVGLEPRVESDRDCMPEPDLVSHVKVVRVTTMLVTSITTILDAGVTTVTTGSTE
jgi:hypothetical protein